MTVFGNILDSVISLAQGKSGVSRTVDPSHLRVFESVRDFLSARATSNPRPCYIVVEDDFTPLGTPSDVSGNYYYMGKNILLDISYSPQPNNKLALEKIIDTHKLELISTLTYPLNWALVDGWCGVEITSDRETILDDEDNAVLEILSLHLAITYREEL